MKKTFLASLFCLAALTACQKDLTEVAPLEEGEAMATFTVSMAPQTKATIDNDGAAANVNRCILEVRTGENKKVYRHVEVSVNPTDLTATFQLPLVISQTYDFLFWADNANFDSSIGKFSDKYYDTQDLTAVKILDETTGNLDAKDAFYAYDHNVEFTGTAAVKNYTLTRPFAQVNIVTDDLENIKAATDETLASDELWPAKISVNYTTEFPTQFNVSTGVASVEKTINRQAEIVYGCAEAKMYNTLNMDYIFVNEVDGEDTTPFAITKAEITSKNGKVITILESAANIPMKRNYRTNILSSFLTAPQAFKVEVSPLWLGDNLYAELPAAPSPDDPQGCIVGEEDEEGNIIAEYTPGSAIVVIPEGATGFIANPEHPLNDGGAYNETMESLTIPASIEVISQTIISMCHRLNDIVKICNQDHDLTIDESAFYNCGSNGDSEILQLTIKGLPKNFSFTGYMHENYPTMQYMFNVGDGDVIKKMVINLPAGWIEAGYYYKFKADKTIEVYEEGILVSKNGNDVN